MAAFEVFVPVQGEIIFTVEADNAADAQDIVSTMDWSDGELNLTEYYESHVELIDDDDDDDRPSPATFNAETGQPYVMRHFRV
jgi:hypothetical protein